MKVLLTFLMVIAIATIAWAEKPVQTIDHQTTRIECPLESIAYDWHFAQGDWGFTTAPCDLEAAPVWEYGDDPYWPSTAWGTSLNSDYPSDAGESLISPSFVVDQYAFLVEIRHAYGMETGYDGGNLTINEVVVPPMIGYPDDEISDSASYYAYCVDGEPGFTGVLELGTSCFDLSEFMGQEIQLSFNFGSDSSVNWPGWGLVYVRVGSSVVADEKTSWSHIKGLYR